MFKIITDNFKKAIKDYIYFLDNDYPYKPVLKIIGDRYRLNTLQRSVLLRGISSSITSNKRKNKIIPIYETINKTLFIDCYNVLLTVGSYLSGNFVYQANDGFIRDAEESHGKIKRSDIIIKALFLVLEYLKNYDIKKIQFLIDSPVSNSKKLADKINGFIKNYNINGDASIVKSPDYVMINTNDIICATSDSIIIDKKDKILDLSFNTLNYHYSPVFISLDELK